MVHWRKEKSVLQYKPMPIPCNVLPGSCPGRAQHCAGDGSQLPSAFPRWGEPVGFTACGHEATASGADLGRDGVRQPGDTLPASHPSPGLFRGLTPLIVPQGWRDTYGRGDGQWGPGSAGGPGCWWPGGPRPGGCRHLENRRGHGVELPPQLSTRHHPAPAALGDEGWGGEGRKARQVCLAPQERWRT